MVVLKDGKEKGRPDFRIIHLHYFLYIIVDLSIVVLFDKKLLWTKISWNY
jgi:hypothetical protein